MRTLINKNDTDYIGNTKTTNTKIHTWRNTTDFETLKTSSSNFDKLTKALETNLKPEDQSNKN